MIVKGLVSSVSFCFFVRYSFGGKSERALGLEYFCSFYFSIGVFGRC